MKKAGLSPRYVRTQQTAWHADHWAGALVPAWSFMPSTSAATLPASSGPSLSLFVFSEQECVISPPAPSCFTIDPLSLAPFVSLF